jgi:hypothetical protein
MEREAVVLLYKLEKIFPPGFFNSMQHLILHLPYEARMGGGGLRSFDGVMQLRGSKKILEQNAKINHVLRQSWQKPLSWRSIQISPQNTLVKMFGQSTTQSLDTMLDMKMIANLAFSLGEVTLHECYNNPCLHFVATLSKIQYCFFL